MSKSQFYKELYALAKGSVIGEFLLVRRSHFTELLTRCGIEQSDIEDCILRSTASNVYISTEKLLENLPEESDYILIGETKKKVLKRLPSFIRRVVDGIPLRLTSEGPFWSINEIAINPSVVDKDSTTELERYLGEVYWLCYKELIDYEGFELLTAMSNLACKKCTINQVGIEASLAIDKLQQYAKFNKIKALIKGNKGESNVLLELLNLNMKCKE